MKKSIFTTLLFLLCSGLLIAQTIPVDSLYLGQTPPGTTPQIFPLSVPTGSFAAERITISNDNTTIYYTGVSGYYPTTGAFINYYTYSGDHWSWPVALFQDYLAAALTPGGDTLLFQSNADDYQSYYSVLISGNWSSPRKFLMSLNSAHYCQETVAGNLYISSIAVPGIGGNDWCRINLEDQDTTAMSLGLPLNSGADNLDFFVSADESYMIIAKGGLRVSYHKEDGSWTNPKSLGAQINFGMGMWGPFVTHDDQYLFYTTGTLPDYSDTHVYWVKIDNLIDSLMYTNYVPYLKNLVPQQYGYVGQMFTYSVPDSTFVDDDGNQTLSYHATLSNGNPLPDWLSFDTLTATFSGIPEVIQTLNLKIKAVDTAGASALTTMKILVDLPSSSGEYSKPELRVYPNPTKGKVYIRDTHPKGREGKLEVVNATGTIVWQGNFSGEAALDLSGESDGLYLLRIHKSDLTVSCKLLLSRD